MATPAQPGPYCTILGIRFFTGSDAEAVTLGLRGGLVVAPAAPLLHAMIDDAASRTAVMESDLALPDSGLMVLVWNALTGDRIPRVSGLKYLIRLLREPAVRTPGATLWVTPTPEATRKMVAWLQQEGHPTTEADCYIAPHYGPGPVEDAALLRFVQERRPAHLMIALGGGVQEKLGYFIRRQAGYPLAIHCTGAAIGFLCGDQVPIPAWADRFYLGWALRCLSAPRKFFPRYWRAKAVVAMLWRSRDRWPAA